MLENRAFELGPRQAFVASQSPLVLAGLSFASPEEVRASLIHCERRCGPPRVRCSVTVVS